MRSGAAAIDSATIVASPIFQLTGSAFVVACGPASGLAKPQLVVGFLAERGERRVPFYAYGPPQSQR